MLPADLKQRASALATRLGISLGELIRQSIEATLRASDVRQDPLFLDQTVDRSAVPANLSGDHDDFLYSESPARDR